MIPFRKAVKLHGVLGRDAGVPISETISDEPYILLALLLESIPSDKPTGLRIARNLQAPVVCSGPDFCGADQDMKEGDRVEVEGELRLCEEDGPVVWSCGPRVMRVAGIKVSASHVRKIDPPVLSMETFLMNTSRSETAGISSDSAAFVAAERTS